MTSSGYLRLEARHALLGKGRLQAEAATALQRRTLDAGALRRLGDIQRGNGDFAAAQETYRRMSTLRPHDAQASWLYAITAGRHLPTPPTGVRAAPFVQRTNFLTSAEGERLLSWAYAKRERFAPAKVGPSGRGRVDVSQRCALAVPPVACKDLEAWFVPKVRALLPTVSAQLGLRSLDDCGIVLRAVAHLNGGYGRPHRDSPPFVCSCYFHVQPRGFSGGDLLLYDTQVGTSVFDLWAFSRLQPTANSIVFHPGAYMHEITPTVCGTGRFLDARFSLTCAIWPNEARASRESA